MTADFDLDSIVDINGSLGGFFETEPPDQFSVLGQLGLSIPAIDLNANASLAVSSIGIAGCASLGTITVDKLSASGTWYDPTRWKISSTDETETLEAGFGYKWGGSVDLWASSCDMGDYEVSAPGSARDASTRRSVTVPPATRAFAIKISGAGGAPVVSLSGPGGARIPVPPHDTGERLSNGDILLEDQKAKATSVLLLNPRAGKWTVNAQPSSTPITGIATAHNNVPPTVAVIKKMLPGGQVGLGLSYAIPSGEKLVLYVSGPHKTTQVLGQVHGSPCNSPSGKKIPEKPVCGHLKFTPLYGAGGTRTIFAIVYRDGVAQRQLKLATFRSAAPRPKAPRLKAGKSGKPKKPVKRKKRKHKH